MTTTLTYRAAAASHPGLLRENNEDRVYDDESAGIFLVVDGMGGRAAGDMAAQTAIDTISRYLVGSDADVGGAITAANNEIYRLSHEHEDWHGMACVLTLAVADQERITVGHVGDSRLYLLWNGSIRKITSDHSLVGELEDLGEITEDQAMSHPQRNEVFRDVGSRPREADDPEFIEIKSFPFRPSAAMLLCTDGLSDMLTAAEINAIAQRYSGDPESVVQELVSAANAAGGTDNISVIFVAGPEFGARTSDAITQVRPVRSRWRRLLDRIRH
jgi:serine/threonine protein phosphatase PrpC